MVLRLATDTTEIGGKAYLETVEEPLGFPEAETLVRFGRKGSDGVYEVSSKSGDVREHLVMPVPLQPGIDWLVVSSAGDSLKCRATGLESVEVGGSLYEDCVRVECEGPRPLGSQIFEATVLEYRAPGIGLVRAVTRTERFEIKLSLEGFEIPNSVQSERRSG
jgi:hypothetical protein